MSRPIRSIVSCIASLSIAFGQAQSWQPLYNQPKFNAGTALLLTDGRIMCNDSDHGHWWALTPDTWGSYINGTWRQLASLPDGYTPLYYASAVLADGRVVIIGGEFNAAGVMVESNHGAIYDPRTDTWASLPPPTGWTKIGDAQSVVLPNGHFLLANPFDNKHLSGSPTYGSMAELDPSTLTWVVIAPAGKTDSNDEEGWTLLADGTILTIDTRNPSHAERYVPWLRDWVSAGSTPQPLTLHDEIGPAVLRPDGTVFATGATSYTAIYHPLPSSASGPGYWTAGPTFPDQLFVADGPASLLPSGDVLVTASLKKTGTRFFEFDGSYLIPVPGIPGESSRASYLGSMLLLPTGQVLFTSHSRDIEIYTDSGSAQPDWLPVITDGPLIVHPGSTHVVSGTQFNGLSQGSSYGDDVQTATNYPLVRATNLTTGHISYWRTHDHSTMAVATGGAVVKTHFDVPDTADSGYTYLEVVANGLASHPHLIVVLPTSLE